MTKVGTIDGWYVGDKAFAWMNKLYAPGVDRTFDGWQAVEIVTLYDTYVAVVKGDFGKGLRRIHVSTSTLYKKHMIQDTKDKMFPVGSSIVLLTNAPRVGLTGTVITPDEARKGGYTGKTDEYVMAVLHYSAIIGGWHPRSLGIVGDLSPVQWPTPKKKPEPKNNDGRSTCFWCGAPTKEFGMNFGHVCTACGR